MDVLRERETQSGKKMQKDKETQGDYLEFQVIGGDLSIICIFVNYIALNTLPCIE